MVWWGTTWQPAIGAARLATRGEAARATAVVARRCWGWSSAVGSLVVQQPRRCWDRPLFARHSPVGQSSQGADRTASHRRASRAQAEQSALGGDRQPSCAGVRTGSSGNVGKGEGGRVLDRQSTRGKGSLVPPRASLSFSHLRGNKKVGGNRRWKSTYCSRGLSASPRSWRS